MQKVSRDLVWLSLQSKTDFSCPATNIFTVLIRRTMKLLHSGFFFFLFYCARVQPVHTWRINSTKMQRLRKTVFCCEKIGSAKIFLQTDTNVADADEAFANLFQANVSC